MAISSSTRKAGPFIGNDATTVFPFAFKVFTSADLRVVRTNVLGVESDLVLDTDYTVALNSNQDNDPGGTVTRATALPTGERLTITSDVEALQPLVLTNNGGFYPRVINDAFDKITIIAQQLIEQVGRSLKLPISSTASATLPDPVANRLIAWNSSANGFTNVDPASIATVAAYADANLELFDGNGTQTAFTLAEDPAVLANLDVSISGVVQVGGEDFTWIGTTLTFLVAPPNGTRIQVRYTRAIPPADLAGAVAAAEADRVATAADRVQTGLDRVATAADRVQTGLDRIATAADAVATAADRVQTGLDRVQTSADVASAAAILASRQPLDADLTAIAALTSAADQMPYATGAQTWALTGLSAFNRTLLATANQAAYLTAFGLVPSASVSYTRSGAGAVQLTADQWISSRWISVLEFIPTAEHAAILAGTSVYDATTDLQEAATVSAAGGLALLFPGIVKSQTITLPSYSSWIGAGSKTGVDLIDDGTATGRSLYINGASNVTLDRLAIKSTNAAGRTGVYGNVRIQSSSVVRIQNCDLGKSSSQAVYGEEASNVRLFNNDIHDCYADGAQFTRGSFDVLAVGNTCYNNGDDNIAFVGHTTTGATSHAVMTNCWAVNNTIRDNIGAGSGIVFLGAVGGGAVSNKIKNTYLNGITVSVVGSGSANDQTYYCRDIVLRDNVIEDVSSGGSGFGIAIQSARGVTLDNNMVNGCASHVINVTGVVVDLTVNGGEYGSPTSGRGFYHAQTPSTDARLILELFTNVGETGVTTALSRNIKINSRFVNLTDDAVQIVGSSGNLIDRVSVAGQFSVARGGGADGVQLSFCSNATLTGEAVPGYGAGALSTGFGANIVSCPNFSADGFKAIGVGDTGLGLTGTCTRASVLRCRLNNNTTFGAFDDGTTTGQLAHNFWNGNGTAATQGFGSATLVDNIAT